MSNVIKRDTLQYLKRVNTPDYDSADFVILDTMSKIVTAESQMDAIPAKYRKLSGNNIVEMTTLQKQAVDDAIADALAQAEAEAKDIEIVFDKTLKAFALVMLDEINKLRVKNGDSEYTLSQLKNSIVNKYDTL